MLKKMDTGKWLFFSQFKFFSDEFTEVLIFIDKFYYLSLLPFNNGGKTIFYNGSKTRVI